MCIVVDPPVFVPMFKENDVEHATFVAVRNWVRHGPGKFVIGGSKYQSELANVSSVIPVLSEYERMGKICRRDESHVDNMVALVKFIESSSGFDDEHLVALVRLTGCRLVCLRDAKARKFLKMRKLYAKKQKVPKLYTKAQHASELLVSANLAPCC
jgi:hypothetical protein